MGKGVQKRKINVIHHFPEDEQGIHEANVRYAKAVVLLFKDKLTYEQISKLAEGK